MIVTATTLAFFAAFRNRQILLVRHKEGVREYDLPSWLFFKEPTEESLDLLMADYFEKPRVKHLVELDVAALSAGGQPFCDYGLFACSLDHGAVSRFPDDLKDPKKPRVIVWSGRHPELFPGYKLSPRASAALHLPYVQNRLA